MKVNASYVMLYRKDFLKLLYKKIRLGQHYNSNSNLVMVRSNDSKLVVFEIKSNNDKLIYNYNISR